MSNKKISELPLSATLDPTAIIPVSQPDTNNGNILSTFGILASQFSAAARVGTSPIGKLIGANMNQAASVSIQYNNLTGYPFQIGDTIFDQTYINSNIPGDTPSGPILSVDPNNYIVILDPKGIKSIGFKNGDVITAVIAQITHSQVSATFQANDQITGSQSGATGNILSDNDTSGLLIYLNSGTFIIGETITSNSGVSAVVTQYTPPARATIENITLTGFETITLNGGNKYIITDIVITNASTSLTNCKDGATFWANQDSNGYTIATVRDLSLLVESSDYINLVDNLISLSQGNKAPKVVSGSIYFSMANIQGSEAFVNIYIYGYIIN